jgi:tyrosyl-tRNA synthetase
MASPSLFRSSTRFDLSICARCTFRASYTPRRSTRRWIAQKSIAEAVEADANAAWQARAMEIKSGKQKSIFTKLEERGLVHAVTG